MRSSTLERLGSELEEILVHSSLSPDGVWAEAESAAVEGNESMDLLKHQVLPFTGNTTNLALIVLDPQRGEYDRGKAGESNLNIGLSRERFWAEADGMESIVRRIEGGLTVIRWEGSESFRAGKLRWKRRHF